MKKTNIGLRSMCIVIALILIIQTFCIPSLAIKKENNTSSVENTALVKSENITKNYKDNNTNHSVDVSYSNQSQNKTKSKTIEVKRVTSKTLPDSSFVKADVVDAYNGMVRLYFTQPVHIYGSVTMCNGPECNIWQAGLDNSFKPLYEDKLIADKIEYSTTVLVKFKNPESVSKKHEKFNGGIIPQKGIIRIISDKGVAAGLNGKPVSSNFTDRKNLKISYQFYTINPYAQLFKVESLSKSKATLIIFQNLMDLLSC